MRLLLLPVLVLLAISCGKNEGHKPGECADGADNDGDGDYDCEDSDCVGAPDCEDGHGDEADADTDADSDSDTDTDTDTDSDTDTDTDTDADTDSDTDADVPDADCTVDASGAADSTTIQGCIDAVSDGQVVVVEAGTYIENLDFDGKGIGLYGRGGSGATVIDGDSIDRVITLDDGETGVVIQGFTLKGGKGTTHPDFQTSGGAILALQAELELRDCILQGNDAGESGGGAIYAAESDLTLVDTTVRSNSGQSAGGMMVRDGSLDASGLRFYDNQGTYQYANGGGLYLYGSDADIVDCTFQGNAAHNGGAIAIAAQSNGETIDLTACAFGGNDAEQDVWFYNSAGIDATLTVTSSIFANGASKTALYFMDYDSTLNVRNVTFLDNQGDAIECYNAGTLDAINNIFVGNEGCPVSGYCYTPTVAYNLSSSNAGSDCAELPIGEDGNISDDPLFTAWYDDDDPTNDDLSLQSESPAVDAGSSSATYNDPDGSRNDMGAFGGPEGNWSPVWD